MWHCQGCMAGCQPVASLRRSMRQLMAAAGTACLRWIQQPGDAPARARCLATATIRPAPARGQACRRAATGGSTASSDTAGAAHGLDACVIQGGEGGPPLVGSANCCAAHSCRASRRLLPQRQSAATACATGVRGRGVPRTPPSLEDGAAAPLLPQGRSQSQAARRCDADAGPYMDANSCDSGRADVLNKPNGVHCGRGASIGSESCLISNILLMKAANSAAGGDSILSSCTAGGDGPQGGARMFLAAMHGLEKANGDTKPSVPPDLQGGE
jgi:hypothetical protein